MKVSQKICDSAHFYIRAGLNISDRIILVMKKIYTRIENEEIPTLAEIETCEDVITYFAFEMDLQNFCSYDVEYRPPNTLRIYDAINAVDIVFNPQRPMNFVIQFGDNENMYTRELSLKDVSWSDLEMLLKQYFTLFAHFF